MEMYEEQTVAPWAWERSRSQLVQRWGAVFLKDKVESVGAGTCHFATENQSMFNIGFFFLIFFWSLLVLVIVYTDPGIHLRVVFASVKGWWRPHWACAVGQGWGLLSAPQLSISDWLYQAPLCRWKWRASVGRKQRVPVLWNFSTNWRRNQWDVPGKLALFCLFQGWPCQILV